MTAQFMDGRLPAKFWNKVTPCPMSGCWLWVGANTLGYGALTLNGDEFTYAHRYSYSSLKGEIPSGLVIDHLCRVRACVNPAHLEAVPQRINIIRGDNPGVLREKWARYAKEHAHD